MGAAHAADYSALFDTWLVLHLARRTLDDALAATRLSGDDFALYHLIALNEPLTPTEIVHWTGMRRSTVSSYLRRMTERHHARVKPNPSDGRSYSIELTRAGRAVYDEANAQFLAVLARVEDALSGGAAEVRLAIEQLDHALRRVNDLPPRPYTLLPSADSA